MVLKANDERIVANFIYNSRYRDIESTFQQYLLEDDMIKV